MNFYVFPAAEKEVVSAAAYYESVDSVLGADFFAELLITFDRIRENPDTWPLYWQNVRHCRTKRFPYQIFYRRRNDSVEVIAVMHDSREPDYWMERIEPTR